MFTGIVTEIGTVMDALAVAGGRDLDIACSWTDLVAGESIAVDGACLTVARLTERGFGVHVVRTSLDRTRFADARALKAYAGSAPLTRATSRSIRIAHRQINRLANAGWMWAFSASTHEPARRHY